MRPSSEELSGTGSWIRRIVWAVLVVATILGILLVSTWINIGPVHRAENADTLLPVLISCWHWTPFYWEQNRMGMLLPLLTMPIKDLFLNLMVQRGISLFLTVASFFAAARYVAGRRVWIPAGAAGAFVFLVAWHRGMTFYSLIAAGMHGVPLTLGFVGLTFLAEELDQRVTWRTGIGGGLLILAMWVNITVVLSLGPILFVSRWMLSRMKLEPPAQPLSLRKLAAREIRGRWGRGLIVFVMTALAAAVASQVVGYRAPWNRPSGFAEWGSSWVSLARNVWASSFAETHLLAALLVLALIGLITLSVRNGREAFRVSVPGAGCLLIGAFAHWALIGASRWVVMNAHDDRYLILPLMLTVSAFAVFAVLQLDGTLHGKASMALAIMGMVGLWLMPLGLPARLSMDEVKADLNMRFGKYTTELLESGCTHFIGSYWVVWPTVFQANMTLQNQGSAKRIWGITYRSRPTLEYWKAIPETEWRVGQAVQEAPSAAQEWVKNYRLPTLEEEQTLETIRTYRAAASREVEDVSARE